MEEFKSEIISRVRSCLISTKGKITLRQLEDDYRTLLGERIPYQKLGFKSLEQFIQSVPSLILARGSNGEVFVDARVSEKTAHISTMIKKQKSSAPKKKVRISRPPKYHRAQMQPPPTAPKWRPPKKNFDYAATTKKTYEKSPRLAAVAHNQFVNGYSHPKVASKVVVPETSGFNNVKKPSPPKELKRYNSSPDKIIIDTNGTTFEDDCSPRSSTMKRISRIMSEISMERDSGNSSPTTEYASTDKIVPEFVKTGDSIADIRSFAAYHKLGDVEVKFSEMPKKSKTLHFCKITVDEHQYTSYPEDFFDQIAAERRASQKALDYLITRSSKRKPQLLSSNEDIMERIPPMLEKHNNAVWMWQIKEDYADKYNEQLPVDWLQVIDNNPYVSIEKCIKGYVLKHCNPNDVLQKGKKLDINLNISDVSVPCNTVNYDQNNRLYAVVTAAHSSNEIWCQQCGTPEYEKFVHMIEQMEVFYTQHKSELLAPSINFGSCYVVNHDGGWIRARALEMARKGIVNCFLIDYGEEIHVSTDCIYVMKREYALEQAQAFVCRLDGLEDLYEVSIDSEHLTALVGKEFVLEVVLEEIGYGDDVTVLVVMYDTDSGASINEELISLLTFESAIPILDKNAISEVYVSCIGPEGDVYVQIRTFGYFRLIEMIKNLTETITQCPPKNLKPPTKESSQDKYYLFKCKMTHKWLRVAITDWSPKGNLAQIHFIDVGNNQIINVLTEKMYPLDQFNDVVSQYPAQAVKVRFMIEQIPSDFVARAEKLLPPDQPVLMKVSSYDNEGVAWVEFFKRTNDGVLVFINKSISVEAELQNSDVNNAGSINNNETNKKRLFNLVQYDVTKPVPSGGSLKKPDLPKVGDYFNVNIPFSVNPWNFFVQPLDSFNKLRVLMGEMQKHYQEIQFSPIRIDDVIPGKIYASKHEDGLWYRTSVLKVIHSGSISVFYCDFGYYTNLTLAQLIPLDDKYMSFPFQALKAKISGIKPIKNKWTMEDCDVFNSLVTKKQFVSILVNIEKDELYKSDIVLQLLLIDTSSDEDVNIKEVLIAKNIATSV